MAEIKTPAGLDTNTALELFSIAGSLNSTIDLDYLLQKIGAAVEKLLDCEASAIMLVSDDGKNLFFKVASGEKAKALRTMTLPIGQGIAGWVAEHRKPEVVADTRQDARFTGKFDKASGFVTRSLLCVPMVYRGEIVGVVEALNKREGTFAQEDVGLCQSLASLASVAITNAKIISEQKNFFSHVLEVLVAVIETSKPGMIGHPVRAAKLACALGRALGAEDYDYRMLYYAGLLHEIGAVALKNPRLLAEMGVSSPSEALTPLFSVQLLDGIKMLEGAIPMIQRYGERFDGTGTGKLKGEAIPFGARILALVEAVEEPRMAGSSQTAPYDAALALARAGAGTRFDPRIVEAFEGLMADPEGTW